jgi:hypothetical protein
MDTIATTVPMNGAALHLFRIQVGWLWHRALARRSQNGHGPWDRMHRLIAHWLHPVRIYQPYRALLPKYCYPQIQ